MLRKYHLYLIATGGGRRKRHVALPVAWRGCFCMSILVCKGMRWILLLCSCGVEIVGCGGGELVVLARKPGSDHGIHAVAETCRLNLAEREELLDIFLASCGWTRIYFAWRPNLPDEADNHLVELAVAGGARFIVTRNL